MVQDQMAKDFGGAFVKSHPEANAVFDVTFLVSNIKEILTNNLMPVIHRLETRASQRRSCLECEPSWEFAAGSFKRCSMASPLSLVRHR